MTTIPSLFMALVPCCLEKRNVFMLINPNTYNIYKGEWASTMTTILSLLTPLTEVIVLIEHFPKQPKSFFFFHQARNFERWPWISSKIFSCTIRNSLKIHAMTILHNQIQSSTKHKLRERSISPSWKKNIVGIACMHLNSPSKYFLFIPPHLASQSKWVFKWMKSGIPLFYYKPMSLQTRQTCDMIEQKIMKFF